MALDARLQAVLRHAIAAYDFPCVVYDFAAGHEIRCAGMGEVEACIRAGLLAPDARAVQDALSNVLYWGYARTGYRDYRVRRFREGVTSAQLSAAGALFTGLRGPGAVAIKKLGLPEFSGLSFVSKVRAFLDPARYAVLDLKLVGLRDAARPTLFHGVPLPRSASGIPITQAMERFYERWSALCRGIAAEMGEAGLRAVDVERGIFYLAGMERGELAAEILAAAGGG